MEKDRGIISFHIQDIDGITIDATNYKMANGAKILLPITSYPKLEFKSNLNTTTTTSKIVDGSKTYTQYLGPTKYVGPARLTIPLDIEIPLVDDVPTESQYGSGGLYNSNSIIPASFYLLFNMYLYNHRYYLTDISPGESRPNFDLPLNILCNRRTLAGAVGGLEIFKTQGVPVIIKDIKINGLVWDASHTSEAAMSITLTLEVDNYGT